MSDETNNTDRSPRIPASLTSWSLVGLGAGLFLGVSGNLGWVPWVSDVAGWLNPLGHLWINALQLIVLPLIITQVLAAIVGGAGGRSIASLGGRVLLLFLLLQAGFGVATMAVSYAVVSPLDVSAETVQALRGQLSASVSESNEGIPADTGGAAGSIRCRHTQRWAFRWKDWSSPWWPGRSRISS